MFYEGPLAVILAFLVSMFFLFNYFGTHFSSGAIDATKSGISIYGDIGEYNLSDMGPGSLDNIDKLKTVSDLSYAESSKRVNYITLNINEVQGNFDIILSKKSKVVGAVYRSTDTSNDVEFVDVLNKWTVLPDKTAKFSINYLHPNKTGGGQLNSDPFSNVYGEHTAYYIHIAKGNAVDKLTFYSNIDEPIKNISIILFLEPVNKDGESVSETNFKTKEKYHEGVRYIIKKGSNSDKLSLKNFVFTQGNKRYGISNATSEVIISYQSPLIVYINEFNNSEK